MSRTISYPVTSIDPRADQNPALKIKVVVLPENCTDTEYVKSLNDSPGALALAMKRTVNPETQQVQLEPLPFVVPGDRFNEKYGWDSVSICRMGQPRPTR